MWPSAETTSCLCTRESSAQTRLGSWVMWHVGRFALRLSNNIISYDWLNSTTETTSRSKTPKKPSQPIHFPYSTSHLGLWYVFDVFLLFCVYLSAVLAAPFLCEARSAARDQRASQRLEFMMVHYLSINFLLARARFLLISRRPSYEFASLDTSDSPRFVCFSSPRL